MSREPKLISPVDQRGLPIHRAMGLPIVKDSAVVGLSTQYRIIYDFTAEKFQTRVLTGFSIENRSNASDLIVAWVDNLMDTPNDFIRIGTLQFMTLDFLQFGPGIIDDTEESRARYLLARLDVSQGTQSSGTIDYSGSGQPSDQDTVNINGLVYEFSNDESKQTSSDFIVAIGVDADSTWNNLTFKLNSTQRFVTASNDTTGDVLTLTAIPGGADGNSITLSDGGTGAVFSGSNLSGGSGGETPVFHVW